MGWEPVNLRIIRARFFSKVANTPVDDINILCSKVQQTFLDTSKEVLGYRKRDKKERILETTWQLIEERKATKQCMLTGSEEERTAAAETYKEKNRAVEKSVPER
nr:hypothetical protein BaRGS_030018 [Batillaria attramentaria]